MLLFSLSFLSGKSNSWFMKKKEKMMKGERLPNKILQTYKLKDVIQVNLLQKTTEKLQRLQKFLKKLSPALRPEQTFVVCSRQS